ncbi:hypothetical protein NDU88_002839 [Pleurodeles waltl]|uniref:Uncharacterized protein n=1 Tax=Pleurodeles waltl TaxID=8319 RepID=A0AAV7M282_PLEWA|nr:hypothetical protein NDU88_002839 [Pleurodeles waltl]
MKGAHLSPSFSWAHCRSRPSPAHHSALPLAAEALHEAGGELCTAGAPEPSGSHFILDVGAHLWDSARR